MSRIASVIDFLKIEDIDLVFNHLETKYGYSSQWRIDCRQYIFERSKHDSIIDPLHPILAFLTFGVERIEPLLNAALCNPYGYAYFNRMIFWLVRERLNDVAWIKFRDGETF